MSVNGSIIEINVSRIVNFAIRIMLYRVQCKGNLLILSFHCKCTILILAFRREFSICSGIQEESFEIHVVFNSILLVTFPTWHFFFSNKDIYTVKNSLLLEISH